MGQPVPDVLRFTADLSSIATLNTHWETDPVDFCADCHAHGNGQARGVKWMKLDSGMRPGTALPGLAALAAEPEQDRKLWNEPTCSPAFIHDAFSWDCWHAQNIYYSILIKFFLRSPAGTIRRHGSGRNAFLPWREKLRSAFPHSPPETEFEIAS